MAHCSSSSCLGCYDSCLLSNLEVGVVASYSAPYSIRDFRDRVAGWPGVGRQILWWDDYDGDSNQITLVPYYDIGIYITIIHYFGYYFTFDSAWNSRSTTSLR